MKSILFFRRGCAGLLATALTVATVTAGAETVEPLPAVTFPELTAESPGQGPFRQNARFRERWLQLRRGWVGQEARDRQAVVFFGDSITQGLGPWLSELFPDLKTANRGIGGDTSRGLLLRVAQDVLPLDPIAVVLLIGTNDIQDRGTPEEIAANVEQLVDIFERDDPDRLTFLCEVFPSSETKGRPKEVLMALNDLYRDLAGRRASIRLVPTWGMFADHDGQARVEDFPDLLHPNERGYRKWAELLRLELAQAGFTP